MFSRLLASFTDRRQGEERVKDDRRSGWGQRIKATNRRVNSALDDLTQTLSINRDEFFRDTPRMVQDSPWTTVEFFSYAESCVYRKPSGKDGIASVCTHPRHEAAGTGIASCAKASCPVDPRKAK